MLQPATVSIITKEAVGDIVQSITPSTCIVRLASCNRASELSRSSQRWFVKVVCGRLTCLDGSLLLRELKNAMDMKYSSHFSALRRKSVCEQQKGLT